MNDEIQRFDAAVDRLLTHGRLHHPSDGEHAAELALAAALIDQRPQPDPQRRARLRQRLLASSADAYLKGGPPMRIWKPAALALLALALLTLALPPVRAFAVEVLRQIGVLEVTAAPTAAEQFISQPPPAIPADAPTAAPPVLSSAAPALAPAAPPAGFAAEATPRGLSYIRRDARGEVLDYLFISTTTASATLPIGAAATEPVSVRGTEGLFVAQAPLYIKDLGRPMYADELETQAVNLLIWEENGQTFSIESLASDRDALLDFASTLQ